MSADLPGLLLQFLERHPLGRLNVAFSGGRDSSVLLDLLARLPQARQRGLRALHVDHGLHPQSRDWARHAVAFAAARGLRCEVGRVDLSGRREVGVEARARAARREVFQQYLQPGDWVLLAHHRRDQAETVLLRLLAGAGPGGLAAMAQQTPLPPGQIGRPLLQADPELLQQWSDRQQLATLLDPANADPVHDRSWLREKVLPVLRGRVPRLDQRLARCAEWMRATHALLCQQADAERLQRLQPDQPERLRIDGWFAMPEPLRFEVLGGWLAALDQARPGVSAFEEIEQTVIGAGEDAQPVFAWGRGQLRRHRDGLYFLADGAVRHAPANDTATELHGMLGTPLRLPDGSRLHSVAQLGSTVPVAFVLRRRRGGERFRLRPGASSRSLKHWLQQAGLPPWQRAGLWLMWIDQAVVALLHPAHDRPLLQTAALHGWQLSLAPASAD